MAAALDLVLRRALEPDRRRLRASDLAAWLADALGRAPADEALFERALTHGSHGDDNYERLEFLGDRVLGLAMAEWLSEIFPNEPEGALSKRFNALVTGPVCAEVARGIGVRRMSGSASRRATTAPATATTCWATSWRRCSARSFCEHGLDAARALVRAAWGDRIHAGASAPQHPKSALQEWAAANNRKPPVYEVVDRSRPAPRPALHGEGGVPKLAEATAEGGSKQEAETAAAEALLAVVATQSKETRRASTSVRPELVEGRPFRRGETAVSFWAYILRCADGYSTWATPTISKCGSASIKSGRTGGFTSAAVR